MNTILGSQPAVEAIQAHRLPATAQWLKWASWGWMCYGVLVLVLILGGLPALFDRSQQICNAGAACLFWQLTPDSVKGIESLGLPAIATWLGFAAVRIIIELSITCALGWLIIWRKKEKQSTLFFGAVFLACGASNTAVPAALAQVWPEAFWFPSQFLNFLSMGVVTTLFCIFPDGRFVPRWGWLIAYISLVISFIYFFIPGGDKPDFPLYDLTGILRFVLLWIAMYGFTIYRYVRTSSPALRYQIKWVLYAIGLSMSSNFFVRIPLMVLYPELIRPDSGGYFVLMLVGYSNRVGFFICLGVAILFYHLLDIDLLINRTLVYGTLTAGIIGVYILLVVGLGNLLHTENNLVLSLLTTGFIAILFQPLRERLHRAVNRVMFGKRNEPYRVITELTQRLKASLATEKILPALVETVATSLKLPYTAIAIRQKETGNETENEGSAFKVAGEYGQLSPDTSLLKIPVVYQAENIGVLWLAPRQKGEKFSKADLRLLQDLAAQAGVAVHSVMLTYDLQRSRERVITASEEERRRLRRELHDGVGPTLASMTQRLDTASRLVERDPATSLKMLAELKAQVKTTLGDIRRIVYALRPPVLDEYGLVSAIREHVAGMQPYQIEISAPEQLPPLPAAVEVAAYRVMLEALTNVERHARAERVWINIAVEAANVLLIEIKDDGQGLPAGYRAGVGLISMRERAEELNGECRISSIPGEWTAVQLRLPLPQQARE